MCRCLNNTFNPTLINPPIKLELWNALWNCRHIFNPFLTLHILTLYPHIVNKRGPSGGLPVCEAILHVASHTCRVHEASARSGSPGGEGEGNHVPEEDDGWTWPRSQAKEQKVSLKAFEEWEWEVSCRQIVGMVTSNSILFLFLFWCQIASIILPLLISILNFFIF